MSHRLQFVAIALATVLFCATLSQSAAAIGYFNLPSNCCQWWGYGCGPGYHACMALGPVSHHGYFRHGVERLPYPPGPPCAGYGCHCADSPYGSEFSEPSSLEPAAEPIPAPGPMLAPTPAPAAFRVPFRY